MVWNAAEGRELAMMRRGILGRKAFGALLTIYRNVANSPVPMDGSWGTMNGTQTGLRRSISCSVSSPPRPTAFSGPPPLKAMPVPLATPKDWEKWLEAHPTEKLGLPDRETQRSDLNGI